MRPPWNRARNYYGKRSPASQYLIRTSSFFRRHNAFEQFAAASSNGKSKKRRAHTAEQGKNRSDPDTEERTMRNHNQTGRHWQQDISNQKAYAQDGRRDSPMSHPWRRICQQRNAQSLDHKEKHQEESNH